MIGDRLALEDRHDERLVDDRAHAATRLGVGGRHDTDRSVRLGRQQLDLEPSWNRATSDHTAVISGVQYRGSWRRGSSGAGCGGRSARHAVHNR